MLILSYIILLSFLYWKINLLLLILLLVEAAVKPVVAAVEPV